jgi:hypothetical protein
MTLLSAAGTFFDASDNIPRKSGYGSRADMLVLQSDTYFNAMTRARSAAKVKSMAQDALASVGQGSLISRAVEAVAGAGVNANFGDVFAEALGSEDLKAAFSDVDAAVLQEIQATAATFKSAQTQYEKNPSSDNLAKLNQAYAAYQGSVNDIAQYAESKGYKPGQVTASSADEVAARQTWVSGRWNKTTPNMAEGITGALQATESLENSMLADKETMLRLGNEGNSYVRALADKRAKIEDLAAKSGVSISELLTLSAEELKARNIDPQQQTQARGMWQELETATQGTRELLRRGGNYDWINKDDRKLVERFAKKQGMSFVEFVSSLDDAYLEGLEGLDENTHAALSRVVLNKDAQAVATEKLLDARLARGRHVVGSLLEAAGFKGVDKLLDKEATSEILEAAAGNSEYRRILQATAGAMSTMLDAENKEQDHALLSRVEAGATDKELAKDYSTADIKRARLAAKGFKAIGRVTEPHRRCRRGRLACVPSRDTLQSARKGQNRRPTSFNVDIKVMRLVLN